MATPAPPRRWHRFRVIFRRCRITVLLVILSLVCFVLYLDRVGLPDFIKNPLVEKLHARGLDLQFSRLRWRLNRGIVADNVVFGRTNDVASPQLTLKEVELRLDYAALLKRQFQVEALRLRQGRLTWPVVSTNAPTRQLSIEHIETDLQLLTNDVWELDNLQAQFGGANIELSGSLTNASAIRDWKYFHGKPAPPGTLQARLRQVADTLEQIHFSAPPQLKLDVRGDARKMEDIVVRLYIQAPGADTRWGTANGFKCYVLLTPPQSNQLSRAEISFHANDATTRWAATTNLTLNLHLFSIEQETNIVHAALDLTVDNAQSRSNRADKIHFTAQWLHSLTNAIPLSGEGQLHGGNIVTDWGSAKRFTTSVILESSTNAAMTNDSWAWWAKLAPYPLKVEFNAQQIHSPKLDLEELACSGRWLAPELTVNKLSAKLYGGSLEAGARLDIGTRAVTFNVASDFDGKKIAPLLTPMAQEWLANYTWNRPPQIKADGALILPASVWTNRHPDWQGELRPTLQLNGQFHVADGGAFRGVRALTADSHFYYSNMWWRLPDLVAVRPEGKLNLVHESNERTKDFYFHLHSTIDPQALRPLLDTNQLRAFEFFSTTQPPVVDGEIRGRWHDHETINGKAHVTATNFTIRGEVADSFQSDVAYTNHVLWLFHPSAQLATTQHLSADLVKIVFDERRMFVTNGFSTTDPAVVVHAIGPHAEHAIEEYHFLKPPTVHVEGVVPMRNPRDADLHFDVEGADFEWWKFQVPRISGKIDWVGDHLDIRNATTDFYLGKASGNAGFDFLTNHSVNFHFDLVATDANLHLLAKDLTDGKTNKLEGLLNLRLEITDANSKDWQHLNGAGRADLRDGLIWDIPIFGVFSPALDTILPGLGSSRARQGSATFTITNGVIDSEDLKIETLMARLRYWGALDLQGAVNARMEAQLFRNTWVVGPVLSMALWPVSKTFEYKITGSIQKPKSDPLFIPKVFFFPFHPVQTIKGLIPPLEESNTNLFPDVAP